MLNNSIPKGIQILNYRSAHTQEEVPTLVPNKIMEHLLEGDDDPFYKTEVLDYPGIGEFCPYMLR